MARPKLIRIEALAEHFAPVFYREVGDRLVQWRRANGFDLVTVSRMLHVSSATLSNVERGIRRFGDWTLREFADAVGGMDMAFWILFGQGKPPQPKKELEGMRTQAQADARAKQWDAKINGLLARGYSERFIAGTWPVAWEHYQARKLSKLVKTEGSGESGES